MSKQNSVTVTGSNATLLKLIHLHAVCCHVSPHSMFLSLWDAFTASVTLTEMQFILFLRIECFYSKAYEQGVKFISGALQPIFLHSRFHWPFRNTSSQQRALAAHCQPAVLQLLHGMGAALVSAAFTLGQLPIKVPFNAVNFQTAQPAAASSGSAPLPKHRSSPTVSISLLH